MASVQTCHQLVLVVATGVPINLHQTPVYTSMAPSSFYLLKKGENQYNGAFLFIVCLQLGTEEFSSHWVHVLIKGVKEAALVTAIIVLDSMFV